MKTVNIKGVSLLVREGTWDEGIAREVIEGDTYRAKSWRPPNGVTIVDVGGHIGSFSCWMADTLPVARVIVYEMDVGNAEVLRKNIALRPQRHRITLREGALGARDTLVKRGPVQKENTGGGYVDWDGIPDGLAVQGISVADELESQGIEYIDLLKLDCEGSEFQIVEALAAMPGGLRARVGCVRAEMHGERSAHKVQEFLARLTGSFPFVDIAGTTSPGLHMVYAWR